MASESQVKQYLAYWFQLGKKVLIGNGREALLPKPVFGGDRYSREFETCWQTIISPQSGDCYLENTDETIAELLTPQWEIMLCSRCPMPVPVRTAGMPASACPCNDLPLWPNTEMPMPRSPVSSQERLSAIRDRLLKAKPVSDTSKENGNGQKDPAIPEWALAFPTCKVGIPQPQAGSGELLKSEN